MAHPDRRNLPQHHMSTMERILNIKTPLLHFVGMNSKLFFILSKWDKRWLRGLNVGVAAAIEHESVLKNLYCATVVDIGANRGQFALIARHCLPDCRIFSFEPLPDASSRYRRVFANDRKAVLYEVAIGPSNGEFTMHISAKDDSSSLLPLTDLQRRMFPGTHEVGTTTVQVRTLDSCLGGGDIREPALLKLDVQGYEMEALKGCASLLPRFTYVYVECSFMELYEGQALADEVIRFLDNHQFRLNSTHNTQYDDSGREVQADFLFKRYSRHDQERDC